MNNRTFQYDALNRLLSGTDAATAGTYNGKNACWSYDNFGNRTIESVQASACSNAGNFASTLVFNANNQLSGVIPLGGGSQSPPTLLYDAAGDVTQDLVTSNQYVYDAEGRICAFSTPNGMGGSIVVGYLYDADGTRVAKGTIHSVLVNGVATLSCDLTQNGFTLTESYVLGPGGVELTMLDGSGAWQRTNVYGGSGQLATYDIAANPAHTSTNGLPATAPALHFQLSDPLGSRRMQTNADGQPETDIQSLPFGDGLTTASDQYAPATADDATPLHFTGKERDTESGNDYFGARYYASTMGRFLSPDWSAKEEPVPYAKLDNPQTLNLYQYMRNNPLGGVDADGHDALWVTDKQTGQVTLVIPVHFTGSSATPENVTAIVNRDNSLDTAGSSVKIQVISTDKPMNGVLNTMDLSPGTDTKNYGPPGEGVNKLGGNTGHINTDNGQSNDAAAHDDLHFAGIKDQYKEGPRDANGNRTSSPTPGYDNSNIMTSRSGTKLNPGQVQEAQKNSTTKQCSTDNGKTTCH